MPKLFILFNKSFMRSENNMMNFLKSETMLKLFILSKKAQWDLKKI